MVLRKSICSLSKYGKKNEELLTPVLGDTRVADFKRTFSRPLAHGEPRRKTSGNILRSNSFIHSTHTLGTEPLNVPSYRRSNSSSLTRSASPAMRLSTGTLPLNSYGNLQLNMGTQMTGANEHLGQLVESVYDFSPTNFSANDFKDARMDLSNQLPLPERGDAYPLHGNHPLQNHFTPLEDEAMVNLNAKRSYNPREDRDKVAWKDSSYVYEDSSAFKTFEDRMDSNKLVKDRNGSAPSGGKNLKAEKWNKNDSLDVKAEPRRGDRNLWRRLRVGAFAPLGFGMLDAGSLSSLSLRAREMSNVPGGVPPASNVFERLVDKVEQLVLVKREKVAELHKKYAKTSLGDVTLAMLFSGLKDVPAMVTETSELDPHQGIKIRYLTVDELLRKLPGKNEDCPFTESVLWFLLTGEVPTMTDVHDLSYELYRRSKVPDHVFKVLDSFSRDAHPLTQYVTAVSALQTESVFRRAYFDKTYHKDTCWKLALEDCLNLVAKNVVLVGYIYRRSFLDETVKPDDVQYDSKLDYAGNLAHFLGDDSELFKDLMRLYLALHSDHEGGNVSAHASHLVGSALADPYFCLSSALCGLSGPLHGMANQECLVWIKKMLKNLGDLEPNVENVKNYARETMAKKQVIPGYGHAVLKVTDPRHTAFMRFALKNFPEDPMVKLLDTCLTAIPEVLRESGKVRNPNPNVDCSTGVLLSHFHVDQPQMFTVFFGLSRSLGILSQLVWARALRYPIERPKSLTLETVEKMCENPGYKLYTPAPTPTPPSSP